MLGEQIAHDGVAGAAAASTHHDADDVAVASLHRGDEVEAGGAGVTGLDAVHALDTAEQLVVVADRAAFVIERFGGEVTIVFWEAVLNSAAEGRLIARGGDLIAVRQARCVLVDRLAHAERACLARHRLGEIVFVACQRFGDDNRSVVGGAGDEPLDRVFDAEGLTRAEAELGRRLLRCVGRHIHRRIEFQFAALELLEQHVERHDLCQRRRMAQAVGAGGLERAAGIGIDDDGGECGTVA